MARRQQRQARWRRAHCLQRLAQQAREAQTAEWRLEPARTDQAGKLGPHFTAGLRSDAFRHHVAGALEHEPDQRHRPELRELPHRPCVGIGQHVDVGALQPQIGQRIEALPGMDRLRQEHPVDPACRCPGDDIGQDPQLERVEIADALQQLEVDRLGTAMRPFAAVERAAGAGELPQLLGHPVHIDRQANPAIADQRDPEFLLPHRRA